MPDNQRPVIIAHRGESYDAPENTLAAIQLAWDRGARAVEIDVRTSKDGDLLVLHDADTARIGGPRRDVSHQTTADLRHLDAGRWKHRRWAGEKIPLFQEVLDTAPSHGRLFIELKEGPEAVPRLAQVLSQKSAAERHVVMSFNPSTVVAGAHALPGVELSQLLHARVWTARDALPRLIAEAAARGCRSLNLERHRRLDAAVIARIHRAGLLVYVWTVNHPGEACRLRDAAIDGIATDRQAWITKHLDATAAERDCGV